MNKSRGPFSSQIAFVMKNQLGLTWVVDSNIDFNLYSMNIFAAPCTWRETLIQGSYPTI